MKKQKNLYLTEEEMADLSAICLVLFNRKVPLELLLPDDVLGPATFSLSLPFYL